MTSIQIPASVPYEVIIGNNLIPYAGNYFKKQYPSKRFIIISDNHVWPLYGQKLVQSLLNSGYPHPIHYVFTAGEQSKNSAVYLDILNFLSENRVTRNDCIIALGGGVVGDISGFTAATYLRGIDYIQVPTTVIAAVDSSVGGKTAINLPFGKNLVGAFYQPRMVLCDITTLNTLPKSVFIDGCAEIIKYAVLFDPHLFAHLNLMVHEFNREYTISRCVELKRDIVKQDEFDRGQRQLLNLGHTIGHSIESLSNYSMTHGNAVAIGISMISRAYCANGLLDQKTSESICRLIADFGLPVSTEFDADSIFLHALSDKKQDAKAVRLIIPEQIGKCRIEPVEFEQLLSIIKAGL